MKRKLLLAIAACIALAGAAMTIPPPAFVAKSAARFAMPWLLDAREGSGKRFAASYLQFALAAQLADRARAGADEPDPVVLSRIISTVQEQVLNQRQFDHVTLDRPVLAAGFGYCDQINAAAAAVAARRFRKVQLFAIYDAKNKTSPHTIARAWSDQLGTWLYFDAYYDTPIVYIKTEDSSPRYLTAAAAPIPSRTQPGDAAILHTYGGWVMSESGSTFGSFLAAKIANRFGKGAVEPSPPIVMPPELAALANKLRPTAPIDDVVYARVARNYAAARAEHLFGSRPRAAYLAAANDRGAASDWRARELAQAARVFASLP